MSQIDKASNRRPIANRVIAVAAGTIFLNATGYTLPAGAADATSKPVVSSAATDESIRPFKIDVPQSQLDDLRKRIADTRWPDKETVNDQSQGIQLQQRYAKSGRLVNGQPSLRNTRIAKQKRPLGNKQAPTD